MPARVPVHWGLSGKPDDWGPAWMNGLLLPAITIAAYALLLFLPLIDPKRKNYALFADTAAFFRAVVTVFLVGMHVVSTLVALGRPIDMSLVTRLAVPLLFIAMHKAGASPWEIVAQRILWAPLWAGALVIATGRGPAVLAAVRTPKVLGLLAVSAVLIATNWSVYVWAVNNGRNIEAASERRASRSSIASCVKGER